MSQQEPEDGQDVEDQDAEPASQPTGAADGTLTGAEEEDQDAGAASEPPD
ncbi:MAG TPA: hypothetical protein VD814_09845 [Nocardioides sp.]|nr:hypothetical protein [Nocardioides sp.]